METIPRGTIPRNYTKGNYTCKKIWPITRVGVGTVSKTKRNRNVHVFCLAWHLQDKIFNQFNSTLNFNLKL